MRNLLDNSRLYETVWRSTFANTLEAYEWPNSAESELLVGPIQLRSAIQELEQFLINIRHSILKFCHELRETNGPNGETTTKSVNPNLRQKLDTQLSAAFGKFAAQKKYFVPLIYLSNKYWANFCIQTKEKQLEIDIFLLCWCQRLLHIQNVRVAVEFFQNSSVYETANIEQCFFEISRFDFGFSLLALSRLHILQSMRSVVHSFLPIREGVLGFPTEESFIRFVSLLTHKIFFQLKHVPPTTLQSTGINVLREYTGQPPEPRMYRLAILAKILQEEVFSILRFQIGAQIFQFDVEVTQFQLLIGKFRVRIKTDLSGIAVEIGPHPDRAMERIVSSKIDYGKAVILSQTFQLKQLRPNGTTQLQHPYFSTHTEKWKSSLKLVEAILNRKLVHTTDSDDLAYYTGIAENRESLFDWISFFMRKLPFRLGFPGDPEYYGQVRYIENQHTFAVVHTNPHQKSDSPHEAVAYCLDASISRFNLQSPLPRHLLTPELIQWLMLTDGFNEMGMFHLPKMEIFDSEYRFLSN